MGMGMLNVSGSPPQSPRYTVASPKDPRSTTGTLSTDTTPSNTFSSGQTVHVLTNDNFDAIMRKLVLKHTPPK